MTQWFDWLKVKWAMWCFLTSVYHLNIKNRITHPPGLSRLFFGCSFFFHNQQRCLIEFTVALMIYSLNVPRIYYYTKGRFSHAGKKTKNKKNSKGRWIILMLSRQNYTSNHCNSRYSLVYTITWHRIHSSNININTHSHCVWLQGLSMKAIHTQSPSPSLLLAWDVLRQLSHVLIRMSTSSECLIAMLQWQLPSRSPLTAKARLFQVIPALKRSQCL